MACNPVTAGMSTKHGCYHADRHASQARTRVMRSFRRLSSATAVFLSSLLIACTSVPTTPPGKNGKTTPPQSPTTGSLLERALRAPAIDLASTYYGEKQLFDSLSLVNHGITIRTPQGRIDSANVGKVRAKLQGLLAIYESAIKQRGYEAIAGVYLSNATASCAQVPSLWLHAMLKGKLGTLNITQNGFTFKFVQPLKDHTSTIVIPGVIVQSSLALSDPANSDFRFRGEVTAEGITLRPDVDAIIDAWPTWMAPLNRASLSSCTIYLAVGQTIVPYMR
jgi:hypothetical protein